MFLQVSLLILYFYSANAANSAEYCFQDKTVIVTGGARGIGYSIADHFLAEGAKLIIILDKNDTNGEAAADKLNTKYGDEKAVFYHCHVYEDRDCWDELIKIYKHIDILVNDAGIIDINQKIEMIHTNFAALVLLSYEFKNANGIDKGGKGGTIINIASRAGYTIIPFTEVYSATKHAVKAFTQNFGHDYNFQRTGIRVIAMCPDFVDTELLKQQMVEDDKQEDFQKFLVNIITADDVADAVVSVYKNATSGTLWTVDKTGFYEAPVYQYISTEDIKNA